MSLFFVIVLVISLLSNVGLGLIVARASRRLLDFDDLFSLLLHEIDTNAKFFDGFIDRPVLSNSPEIVEATRGMRNIRDRLKEFVTRIGEVRNENDEQDK